MIYSRNIIKFVFHKFYKFVEAYVKVEGCFQGVLGERRRRNFYNGRVCYRYLHIKTMMARSDTRCDQHISTSKNYKTVYQNVRCATVDNKTTGGGRGTLCRLIVQTASWLSLWLRQQPFQFQFCIHFCQKFQQ